MPPEHFPFQNALGLIVSLAVVGLALLHDVWPVLKAKITSRLQRQSKITIKIGGMSIELKGVPEEDFKKVVESLKSNGDGKPGGMNSGGSESK